MDKQFLKILACPLCKGKLIYDVHEQELLCRRDKLAFPIRENIPVMLADEARHLNNDEV